MFARRLRSMMVVSLCGLVCGLMAAIPAVAGATQFGSQGNAAGQFEGPSGVALDRATGDLYVPDRYNHRVDKFDGSGNFLFAWGWSVNQSGPADELQTCTTTTGCRNGAEGAGAGEFAGEGPQGVAVDNNEALSDLSAGDVYVLDWEGFRVEKFNAAGEFQLMFGGGVNETTNANVCLAGEKCKRGTQGAGDGQFEWAYGASGIIAVGPGGAVYVGDKARVEVFEPSGAWRENISLSALSGEGKVTSLTVNSAGDVFVKDQGVPGVHEFAPNGVELPVKFDEGSEAVEAITLDESGDVFVADATGGFHVAKYSPAGQELSGFGSKTASSTTGIAFSDALSELYVSGGNEVWALTSPSPGPWIEPGSGSATPGLRGAATFEVTAIPESNPTEVKFEYVDEAHFQASGFASASSTTATAIGSSFEDQHVEASLPAKTLVPGVTYEWRVVATDNANHTADGPQENFEEVPPADVEGPWAANVASSSTTLAAQINPLESSTEYRLEWGTSTAYGHVLTGNVGEGLGYIPINYHLQELEPNKTYHFRLITMSEAGSVEGLDHVFTTQRTGEELSLPDDRAWELVSPADKKDALIQPLASYHVLEAAAEGGAIAYEASDAVGENAVGKGVASQIMSTRGPGGWHNEDISISRTLPPEGTASESGEGTDGYVLFSPDLSLALVQQELDPARPLSSEATEQTPYLRDNLACETDVQTCYTPLVTARNVELPNVHFGGPEGTPQMKVIDATSDLTHVVVQSPYALTSEAVDVPLNQYGNLYEWSAGRLQLVNVLPDHESTVGAETTGYMTENNRPDVAHSMSSDGRRIVWSRGYMGSENIELFVRDMVEKRTVKIGGLNANFQTMSSDGTRVFYRENGELYELNVNTEVQTDLTPHHGAGEANAGVQDAILGSSEDGSYVYFVATGVLASGATGGADNLYLLQDGAGGWETTYITTLSSADEKSWFDNGGEEFNRCGCKGVEHTGVTSRVTANGRYLTFMSQRSLTGYDNVDALSGQPDEEVYLYDAVAKRLVCASCNPSGARPVGVLDGQSRLLVDPEDAWGARGEEGAVTGEHWLAGMTPSWQQVYTGNVTAFYQPRFLSDDGRLFFDSPDALVPQATNGLMDVYQYEPSGVGGCTTASSSFNESSAGCVSLISAGTSSSESAFYDASESGDDVFFITASKLVPADYDTSYDVYDARVCSASAQCSASPLSPPPCTSGDACKAAPSLQPEIFGAPASQTFSGAGNISPTSAVKTTAKPKSCKKGYVKKKNKCVKHRAMHRKKKRKKTDHNKARR